MVLKNKFFEYTIDKTAISGKSIVTALGADYVLIGDTSDADNLKKARISDFASAGGNMSASTYDPTPIAGDVFDMDNMVEGAATKILTANERTAISTNSGKDTNATHTGEVTGATGLTVNKTAISGKSIVTALGADYVLIGDTSDANNLKKALISDFASAGGASAGGSSLINIFLPAEAAYLPVTNPAGLIEEAGATVYAGHSHLTFDDTTSEHAIWRVPVPDYDGGNIVVTAYSKVATTPAGAKTLQYNVLTIGLANSEAFAAAITSDTTVNISHSLNTTELLTDIMIASATIDPANVAADDLLIIELARDVATDDLVGDGELVGIMLEYTRA